MDTEFKQTLYDHNIIKQIKNFKQSTLDLSENELEGKCVKALLSLDSLEELDLSSNLINLDEPLSSKSIRILNLSNNNIENVQILADFLKENTSLTKLDLSFNPIDLDGARILARALTENKTLTTLILNYTNITNKGAIELASIKTLKNLSLQGNGITNTGAKAFAIALVSSSLSCLDLRNNKIDKDGEKLLRDSIRTKKENEIQKRIRKMLKIAFPFLTPIETEILTSKAPNRIERLLGHSALGHGINVFPILSQQEIDVLSSVSSNLYETSKKYKEFQLFL